MINNHFDYAQRRIKEINEDPETREKIMLYETRMLEREQAAGKAGYEQGMQRGIKEGREQGKEEGKIDVAKVILENQMDNGSTLAKATEFIRNLTIIPNEKLDKNVAISNKHKN
ncbi:hypothetical protein, partial [Lactobacillus taiwanensis]|uniref:hypothetical protein n=1 Tax=Lactobacillus taiwanensis TaxID=508451 RepID=UPI00352388F4